MQTAKFISYIERDPMKKILKAILALSAFLAASHLGAETVSCPVAQFQWKVMVYDDAGHFLHTV